MNTPQTLTTKESNDLIAKLHSDHATPLQQKRAIRDTCIALLMLDAGLRVGEVVQLRRSSLVMLGEPVHQIYIQPEITKTKSERVVPTTQRLRDSIKEVSNYCWPSNSENLDGWAFQGNPMTEHLTTRQVERIIGYGSIRALGRVIHPHLLRHTFASRLMRVTNSRIVQQLLGHKSLTSTQIYTHPNGDDLNDAIGKL